MANEKITLNGVSKEDLELTGKLGETGMNATEIADAIEKAHGIQSSASEIDASVNRKQMVLPKALISEGILINRLNSLSLSKMLESSKWVESNEITPWGNGCIQVTETALGASESIIYPCNLVFNKNDTVSIYFWSDGFSNYGNIQLSFSTSGENMFNYISTTLKTKTIVKPNEWNNIIVPISDFTSTGNATLKSVFKQFQIIIYGTANKLLNCKFAGLYKNQKPRTAITFSFDDCNETDYTVAYPSLKSRGFSGTSYIISEEIGTTVGTNPVLKRLTLPQLQEMHANGWGIGIHGKDYYNWVTEKTIAEAEISIKACRNYIIDNNLVNEGIESVAYPHGQYNDDVIALLKRYGVTNARTTNINIQASPIEDMYKLKLGMGLSSSLEDNIAKLETAIAKGGGLINIYGHDIIDGYTISPQVFDDFVQYIYDNYRQYVTTIPQWVKDYETGTII